jgi:uncharacterized membrane protein YedE/YeeE
VTVLRGWALVNASAISSFPLLAAFTYGRWPATAISWCGLLQRPLTVLVM